MATISNLQSSEVSRASSGAIDLLIAVTGPVSVDKLSATAAGALHSVVPHMLGAATPLRTAIAYPVIDPAETPEAAASSAGAWQFLTYTLPASAAGVLPWLASETAYRAIAQLAKSSGARACLLIGQDLAALQPGTIEALAQPLLQDKAQLTMPIYPTGKYDGLLNSALFYPLSRALYGKPIRYPLAQDFGIASGPLLSRMASERARPQEQAGHSILWPGVECALADSAASSPVAQSFVAIHHESSSDGLDLSTVLARLAGLLFESAERDAAIWQRVRGSLPTSIVGTPVAPLTESEDVDAKPLIESFSLGLRNLQEVWGLVLPPVTLLELKRMARLPQEQFRMPDALWARIVYDFALAHRLRTISRNHLLGALTPLYLGWVASYVNEVRVLDAAAAEDRIERLAVAFEAAKPYFVSRWRWPDRFNP